VKFASSLQQVPYQVPLREGCVPALERIQQGSPILKEQADASAPELERTFLTLQESAVRSIYGDHPTNRD